jgi:hypothetical protein
MISEFPAQARRLDTWSAPASPIDSPRDVVRSGPPSHADLWLRPGNLVAVCDELGAQMFSVVDGEVTFTARAPGGERRWRGRLGAQGLAAL